jgi:enoyl-CoA hydratase/carnithine racemase
MSTKEAQPSAPPEPVLFERVGDHIAVVTLNRPAALNTVNAEMTRRLGECVRAVEADPLLRVAILTGAGEKAFCAGADLKEIFALGGQGAQLFPAGDGFGGFATFRRTKPWIAAVGGFVLGGGFDLMIACDLVVAATDASLGLPEVKRGGVASGGAVYRLPRSIPLNVAREIILTGDPIDAQRAHDLGLVNHVVAREKLRETALGLAERIAVNAPIALRESLEICRVSSEHSETELQRMADAVNEIIGKSQDAREGQAAFLERRLPRWTGK